MALSAIPKMGSAAVLMMVLLNVAVRWFAARQRLWASETSEGR
jgi:hypothetical protein